MIPAKVIIREIATNSLDTVHFELHVNDSTTVGEPLVATLSMKKNPDLDDSPVTVSVKFLVSATNYAGRKVKENIKGLSEKVNVTKQGTTLTLKLEPKDYTPFLKGEEPIFVFRGFGV